MHSYRCIKESFERDTCSFCFRIMFQILFPSNLKCWGPVFGWEKKWKNQASGETETFGVQSPAGALISKWRWGFPHLQPSLFTKKNHGHVMEIVFLCQISIPSSPIFYNTNWWSVFFWTPQVSRGWHTVSNSSATRWSRNELGISTNRSNLVSTSVLRHRVVVDKTPGKLTNVPWKGIISKGKACLPIISFQGRAVSFWASRLESYEWFRFI